MPVPCAAPYTDKLLSGSFLRSPPRRARPPPHSPALNLTTSSSVELRRCQARGARQWYFRAAMRSRNAVTTASPLVPAFRRSKRMKSTTIVEPTIAGTAYRSRSQRSSEGTSLARTSRSTPPPTAVARPSAADEVSPSP